MPQVTECQVCLGEIPKSVKCLHCDKIVCGVCAERHSTEMRRDVEHLLSHVKGKHQNLKSCPQPSRLEDLKRRTKELKYRIAEITNSIVLALDKNLSESEHQLDNMLRAEVKRNVKMHQIVSDMDVAIKASSSVLEKTSENPLPQEEMVAIQKLLLGCVSGLKANEAPGHENLETNLIDVISLENLKLIDRSLKTNTFANLANSFSKNNVHPRTMDKQSVKSGRPLSNNVMDSNIAENAKSSNGRKMDKLTSCDKVNEEESVRVFFDFSSSTPRLSSPDIEDTESENSSVKSKQSSGSLNLPQGIYPPSQIQTMSAKKVYVQLRRPYGTIFTPTGEIIVTDESVYGDGNVLANEGPLKMGAPPYQQYMQPPPPPPPPPAPIQQHPVYGVPGYSSLPNGPYMPGVYPHRPPGSEYTSIPSTNHNLLPQEIIIPQHDILSSSDDQSRRISSEDDASLYSQSISTPPSTADQMLSDQLTPVEEDVPSPIISQEQLESMSAEDRHQLLGDQLFMKISELQPDLAAKITGMLLELSQTDVLELLNSGNSLKERVDDAIEVLKSVEIKDNIS